MTDEKSFTFDKRISLGNLIAAGAILVSAAGSIVALQSSAVANGDDIDDIKKAVKELQADSATKQDVAVIQSRVGPLEAYKEDTIDRMARMETKLDQVLREVQKQ